MVVKLKCTVRVLVFLTSVANYFVHLYASAGI